MKSPQKIVNQIRDCLVGNPDFGLLRTLASEYAEFVKIANTRLEQCSLILSSGDEYQTLQMAEVHPPLLDLVATLSFQEYSDWKRLCQEKSLPVPERLNEKAISSLNALYHKGLSPTHPYYKQYRTAMFEKNEEKALQILFTIARLNSSDAVAQTDLERIQKRVLDKKIQALSSALNSGDQNEIVRLAGEIDLIDPKHEHQDPLIEKAQQLLFDAQKQQAFWECKNFFDQLKEHFSSGTLDGVKSMLDTFLSKKTLFQIVLSEVEEQQIADSESWFGKLLKALDSIESENEAQAQVKKWLDEHEAQLKKLSSISDGDLKYLIEHASHSLSKTLVPSAHLKTRIDSFLKELNKEHSRRSARFHKKVRISLVLFACILLTAAWGYWKYTSKQNSLSALAKYQKERRVGDALKVLSKIGKVSFLSNPFIKESDIKDFDNWAKSAKAEGDQALYLLGQFEVAANKKFNNATIGENMAHYKQLTDYSQTLPDEYRYPISSSLQKYNQTWLDYLQSEKDKFDKTFNDLLTKAESSANAQLSFSKSVDKIREGIPDLQRYEQQLSAMLSDPNVREIIPNSQVERLGALRVKVASFKLEVDNYDDALSKLKNNLSEKTFFTAFRLLADSKLVSANEVRTARDLSQNHNDEISNFIQILLMPENPEGWKTISNGKIAQAIPTNAQPDEISAFVNLRDSQELRDVWKYEIHTYSKRKNYSQPDEIRMVYSLGALPTPVEKTDLSKGDQYDLIREWSGSFYDPKTHPETIFFLKRTFSGIQNKKSDTAIGDILDKGTITPESQMFLRLGVDDFYSGESKSFKLSLFTILDRLRNNKDAHPMFKAYVHLMIASIADNRPTEWGIHLVPSMTQHTAMLQDILKPLPAAGDWMVARRKGQFESKLTQFYLQTTQPSYETQFKLHSTLFQDVVQAGFSFAGYIGLDGKAVLLPEGLAAKEVWGMDKSGKISLIMKSDDNKSAPKLIREPAAFSPLYVGKVDRLLIKKKAYDSLGITTKDKNYEDYLPVYFRDTP